MKQHLLDVIQKNLAMGPVRNQAVIAYILGIKQLIVCINQMDNDSVKYSQENFNEIKQKMSKLLMKIGFKVMKIPFIPISAFNGENVVKPSENMEWYNGFSVKIKKQCIEGCTVLDAMDNIIKEPNCKRAIDKPFRFFFWYALYIFTHKKKMLFTTECRLQKDIRLVVLDGCFVVWSIKEWYKD